MTPTSHLEGKVIRYAPERELPEGAYLPGRSKRPKTTVESERTRFDPADWERDSEYLFGFDLLNHGYPWEAHETWERIWRGVDRVSPVGKLLQALIKLAASRVKLAMARTQSAERHARDAVRLVSEVATAVGPAPVLCGIDLEGLVVSIETQMMSPFGEGPAGPKGATFLVLLVRA